MLRKINVDYQSTVPAKGHSAYPILGNLFKFRKFSAGRTYSLGSIDSLDPIGRKSKGMVGMGASGKDPLLPHGMPLIKLYIREING